MTNAAAHQIKKTPTKSRAHRGVLGLSAVLTTALTSALLTTVPSIMTYANTDTSAWTPSTGYYQISSSKVPFKGKVERRLSQDPAGHWVATSSAKAFASRLQETSHFELGSGCGIKTKLFTYERKVFGKSKSWRIATDWTKQEITYSTPDDSQTINFSSPSLVDRLSEQYSVRCFVRSGAETFSFTAVRRDQLKEQIFKRVGVETLETALGKIKAVKVEKQHESDDRETTLWFAPELDYKLVKLIQHDDDETITIEIRD